MAAPPDDATSQLARVVSVETCGSDGVLLRLDPRIGMPNLAAGRFFMLRRADGVGPLIPRPFSLFKQEGSELEFLIKVIGDGTRALAGATVGSEMTLIGPLGNGWPQLEQDPPLVMLAGGIGSAPFYELVRQRLAAGAAAQSMCMIYGSATAGFLYDLAAFEALGVRVLAATDDGTHGFKGNVLQCLEAEWEAGRIPRKVQFLACGPEPMLAAAARLAEANDLPAWLSLESYMGCGVGICNGCVVPTREDGPMGDWPNAKCCVEGPVFALEAIRI
ncbi:MAG: dihydroorotate dehydrogenase electron transfer subunit [Candidatus Paceibacteria bacterium]|jgi:dihydroorotate dehydrogenase electron transfer subunit